MRKDLLIETLTKHLVVIVLQVFLRTLNHLRINFKSEE